MTHLDEGTLQALLDGELGPDDRAGAERHLAACAACAAEWQELRALRDRFRFALRPADLPAPTEPALASVRRRRAAAGAGREWRRALVRAALLVLGVGGVAFASAVVPGSPVRGWLAGDEAPPAAAPPALERAPEAAPPARPPEPPPAGISIRPDDGRVRVVLSATAPELRLRTRVGEGELAEVRALGRASDARFRTGPGRIEVVGAGAGEVEVVLPREARTAVVEANGRVYLLRQGGRTRLMQPVEQDDSAGVVFRVAP